MLYEEASRAKIAVSLATIYNTLHQFTTAGLLREVTVNGSKTYFDTNVSDHHHFFIENEHIRSMFRTPIQSSANCLRCRRVTKSAV